MPPTELPVVTMPIAKPRRLSKYWKGFVSFNVLSSEYERQRSVMYLQLSPTQDLV